MCGLNQPESLPQFRAIDKRDDYQADVRNGIPGRTHTRETTVTLLLIYSPLPQCKGGPLGLGLLSSTRTAAVVAPGLLQGTCFSFCRFLTP